MSEATATPEPMTPEKARAEYDRLHDAYLAEKDPTKRAAADKTVDDFIEEHAEALGVKKTPAPKPPAPKPAPTTLTPPSRRSVRDEAIEQLERAGIHDAPAALEAWRLKLDDLSANSEGRAALGKRIRELYLERPELFRGKVPLAPVEALEHFDRLLRERRLDAAKAFRAEHGDAIDLASKARARDLAAQREAELEHRRQLNRAADEARRLTTELAMADGRVRELVAAIAAVEAHQREGHLPTLQAHLKRETEKAARLGAELAAAKKRIAAVGVNAK